MTWTFLSHNAYEFAGKRNQKATLDLSLSRGYKLGLSVLLSHPNTDLLPDAQLGSSVRAVNAKQRSFPGTSYGTFPGGGNEDSNNSFSTERWKTKETQKWQQWQSFVTRAWKLLQTSAWEEKRKAGGWFALCCLRWGLNPAGEAPSVLHLANALQWAPEVQRAWQIPCMALQSLTLLSRCVWESHQLQTAFGACQGGSQGVQLGKQSFAPTWRDDALSDAGYLLRWARSYSCSGSAGQMRLCTDQTTSA